MDQMMGFRRATILGALALVLLLGACGDRFGPAPASSIPLVTQQTPGIPIPAPERVELTCPNPAKMTGEQLSARFELSEEAVPSSIHLRWFDLAGIPTATIELPSDLIVYRLLIAELANGAETLVTVGYDQTANRGELAWWPHTADPTLPPAARTILAHGATGSIFFDVLPHEGDLLVLDIQCNEIYRVEDSDADGIWDTPASTPFATSALFGMLRPVWLFEQGSSATRVRLGTTGLTKSSAHAPLGVAIWELEDADTDGVAESLIQFADAEGHFAPRIAHTVTGGLQALALTVEPDSSYRVLAVGATSNEELAMGAAVPAESGSVWLIAHLSRALTADESIFTENTTYAVEGEHHVVAPTDDSIVAVDTAHTFDAQQTWTGWSLRIYGSDLSVNHEIEVVLQGGDAPVPATLLTLSAGTYGSVTATLPATTEPDVYVMLVRDAQGEDVGQLTLELRAP